MKRLLILAFLGVAACTSAEDDATEHAASDITDVSPSAVKEQTIDNCWLYATAAWAESMHNGAPNAVPVDLSEVYWTYWYFFDQLTTREHSLTAPTPFALQPEGTYLVAAEIIARRGWMTESDFATDAVPTVDLQRDALAYLRSTLRQNGPLSTPELRTPETVIKYLNAAFFVKSATAQKLTATFGEGGERNFHDAAVPATDVIHRAGELAMRPDPKGHALTLADVIGESPTPPTGALFVEYQRKGDYAWRYRATTSAWDNASLGYNEGLVKMIQKTLHSGRPVLVDWKVDDSLLDQNGTYRGGTSTRTTFNHESIFTDYEVETPDFGLLRAGVTEARPEALASALDARAEVKFFRIKNSWGTAPLPGVTFAAGAAGYNDLTQAYLNGVADNSRRLIRVALPGDIVYPDAPTE